MNRIAARYTTALLELAEEEKRVAFYRDQMTIVKKTLRSNPDLLTFFNQYIVSKEDKKKVIREVFAADDNESMVKFLCIIIDRDRSQLMQEIVDDFLKQANEQLGIASGIVYSARLLDERQLKELEAAIGKKLNKQVILENYLDTDLIAGVKVIIDDRVIDGSLKNKIYKMKNSLLSRGG